MNQSIMHDSINFELDQLQADYVAALDNRDIPAWLATFSDQSTASYICTTRENLSNGHELALMMDDCRARLEDRVTYISKIWAGTFQDYQTRHIVQRLSTSPASHGSITIQSSFAVFITGDTEGVTSILVSGVYEDQVTRDKGRLCFLSKRVILDTAVLPRYIVYPI